MSTRQLLVLLAGFASMSNLVASGEARCPGDVETLRYHSLGNSEMGIRVMVNGSGPFEFLLDTGSLITIVEPSLAAELHLTPEGHAGVVSGVRRAVVDRVRLERVEAGRSSVGQVMAAVQSLGQIQASNPGIRGILGENFLGRFDVLIDRPHGVVCLDTSGQMRKNLQGESIPLITKADSDSPLPQPLLVPVKLGNRQHPVILRLDSGANVPYLYANRLDDSPGVRRQGALQGSVTGKAAEFFALMPAQDVRIGTRVIRDVVFATPVRSKENVDFNGEDGLLPTVLFKRVLICYAAGYVVLEPR